MKGKFKDQIGLKNGGTVVDARGWIDWAKIPKAVKKVRVGATIIQDAGTPTARGGTAWASTMYERPNGNGSAKQSWQCDVPEDTGQAFQTKKTQVGGVFVSAGGKWVWAWGDEPDIVPTSA